MAIERVQNSLQSPKSRSCNQGKQIKTTDINLSTQLKQVVANDTRAWLKLLKTVDLQALHVLILLQNIIKSEWFDLIALA